MKFHPTRLFFTLVAILFVQICFAQEPPSVTPSTPEGPIIDPNVQKVLDKGNNNESSTKGDTDKGDTKTNDTDVDENADNGEDKEDEERKIKFDLRQSQLPDAKIWGQQFFRDQSVSLFTRSRDIKAIDSYLLGIGDELAITVWGATDYSSSVAIDEEGFINLTNPQRGIHVPRLYIKEMKFAEAKKAIIERLENHMNIKNSQVSIELNYSRSLTINITGEVFNPGSYTIPAVNTAFNALVASGGPSQIGSVRMIKVYSSQMKTRTLDVYKFMNNPNIADEFFLHNNDYINVPLAGRVVEIEGAVERPFFYELIEKENLIELIDYAGGLRPDAYRRNIQIIRYENDEEKLIDVNLAELVRRGKNFDLKDGDRINVNPIKQAYANYITVKGAVKLPGTYELEANTTIYDVLMKSGIIRSAVMERIYVKRLREDLSLDYIPINVHELLDDPTSAENKILNPFDEIEVKYKSEFIDKYNIKIYGAVRKTGSFEFSDNLVLSDVLYMANGLKREASNSHIEISRLTLDATGNRTYVVFKTLEIGSVEDSLKVKGADAFFLEPYDQIFVRTSKDFEAPKNVRIHGEIMWPGTYTMSNDDERVWDLIKRAGGWTNIAFLKGAKLMRQGDGLVLLDLELLEKEGENSRFNYVLRAGDIIRIPKLKDLVSIAGKINHPAVKENAEIATRELDLELEKAETEIEKKEILLEVYKKEIQNPRKVNIPFHVGKRANFYIKEYGAGIDWKQGGRQRLVYVRYANGMVKKTRHFLFFKVYPKVEKGAMVYVGAKEKKIKKERKPVNWYKIITDTLALAVSALSIYAIVRAMNPPKQ
ncbi:SLBB domain-containing protein [Aureispira anguillae]|uniref:SLBB domain-containing protein n=1 Tax=Aureispira anguillae TaxID=2864201 RepID=A0A915YF55_9BACT|nr:SLBB domain-containing protein [Aureispira anguillae]BDS11910.1 SLBB domain-containing protein [Aureispira anguillae]